MAKKNKEIVDALSNITQLGLSVAISFLLWIFIALKIKSYFNLGNTVMIFGVIFGFASAAVSFWKSLKKISLNANGDGKGEN